MYLARSQGGDRPRHPPVNARVQLVAAISCALRHNACVNDARGQSGCILVDTSVWPTQTFDRNYKQPQVAAEAVFDVCPFPLFIGFVSEWTSTASSASVLQPPLVWGIVVCRLVSYISVNPTRHAYVSMTCMLQCLCECLRESTRARVRVPASEQRDSV